MTDERTRVRQAVALLEERKAENIVIVDLNDVAIPTSYFVIAETDNPAHAKALVNSLRKGLPKKPKHTEASRTVCSTRSCQWRRASLCGSPRGRVQRSSSTAAALCGREAGLFIGAAPWG